MEGTQCVDQNHQIKATSFFIFLSSQLYKNCWIYQYFRRQIKNTFSSQSTRYTILIKKNLCEQSSNKIIPISTNLQLSGRYSILSRKNPYTYLRFFLKKSMKFFLPHLILSEVLASCLSIEFGNRFDCFLLSKLRIKSAFSHLIKH